MGLILFALLSWNVFAYPEVQLESHPWDIHLVLHSKKGFELAQLDQSSTLLGSQEHLFLNPIMAKMTVLDKLHVRFEVSTAVQVSIHDSAAHEQQAVMAFKHFVVKLPPKEIESLLALQQEPYFVFDELSEQRIIKFAEKSQAGTNYDDEIKYFSKAFHLPQLRRMRGLRIFLPIEDIGTPQGSPARLMIVGELQGHLPWFSFTQPKEAIERPLGSVYSTFDAQDPIIHQYLAGLLKMDSRRQDLERVGWLKPLVSGTSPAPKQNSIPSEIAPQNNVVSLFSRLQCRHLF